MDPMRARKHYIILGIDETGENGVISWRNRAVEHSVEHNVPRSFLQCSTGNNSANYLIM